MNFVNKFYTKIYNLTSTSKCDNYYLTKNKDVDMMILNNLDDDKDILNLCLADSYFCFICSKNEFWLNRLIKKYSTNSADYKINNWREYYVLLHSILSHKNIHYLVAKAIEHKREDVLKIIKQYEHALSYSVDGEDEKIVFELTTNYDFFENIGYLRSNGRREGKWESFYHYTFNKSGNNYLHHTQEFKDGKKHGQRIYYDNIGNITIVEFYDKGNLIKN